MTELLASDVELLRERGWNVTRIDYLQKFLQVRSQLSFLTPEMAITFADGNRDVLGAIAAMLQTLDPSHEDLPLLYAANSALERQSAPPPSGPGKGRTPKFQVPLEDVSSPDVERIMNFRLSSGQLASVRLRKNMLVTLRQIYGAARRAGFEEVFDRPALAAFREELDVRGVKARTVEMEMKNCRYLGKVFDLGSEIIELINLEGRSARHESVNQQSVRKSAFQANPISPIDYATKAHEISVKARDCEGGRQTRHRLFMIAGILAFLSWIPARLKDLLGLRVGKEIVRTGEGWHLDLETSKSKFDLATPNLPDELTPYLDDLILIGADPGFGGEVLDRLYKIRVGLNSPLIARIDLRRNYGAGTVFEWLKEVTGHGSHAARKSMADHCAEIGLPIQDGMALLGHRSARTTQQHYEVFAEQHRRKQTLESLSQLRRDLSEDDGTFRTPSGRLVDVQKINKKLRREGGL